MSNLTDIVDGLHTICLAALPAYKAHYKQYERIDTIQKGNLPAVMIFNADVSAEDLPHRERREVTTLMIYVVRKPGPKEALLLRTDVETLVVAIHADMGLGSDYCDSVSVVERQYEEQQANNSLCLLAVRTEVVI